ncbi:dipeptide/oligopeptide/nickel ABC transporter permease/ATP-binding protein [Subtercola sp. YIM 133946]|uniref:dipeptide/oligopeptide/nickel ABC transporter permease/ATP-binding protein n=1 Tax=Subtercola sp. YIM 133946 TaxID=3118909 RepID=UPI002F94899E
MSAITTATEAIESPNALRRLFRRPLALACIGYLLLVILVAILAPVIWPGVDHEQAGDLIRARQGSTPDHWFGTDALGRDVLQRLLVGTRVTMVGVVEGMVVVLALGVPLGVIAGYFGGLPDRILTWISDLTFSIPGLIVILVVLSIFKASLLAAMITFGLLVSPHLIRLVRSATLPVSRELYIEAARVSGLSRFYILRHHVLPRIAGPIIVQASFLAAAILLVQSGLAYLNLIIEAPAPSWGGMIAEGLENISSQPWLIWPPGIAIGLTMLAFLLLSDQIRDVGVETWQGPRRRIRRKDITQVQAAALRVEGGRSDSGDDGSPAEVALLSMEGVRVSVSSPGGELTIIEGVTLDVRVGETVGLVGESGSGKTMTAMAILGLLTGGAQITSGEIRFAGRNLVGLSEQQLRRIRGSEIGLISQEPMVGFNPVFRIGTQLEDTLRLHQGMTRRQARVAAIDLLRRVRLPDPAAVARRYPHELSGGMAQRVAIARALSGNPTLLIADEPTTALDVTVQAEILELLRELAHDERMAILLVSHDWGVIADVCDRAVVMYAGQVVERAGIIPIFREPMHPYTAALLSSNPHHAIPGDVLPTIPGTVPKPGAWPVGCHFQARCRLSTTECGEAKIPMLQPTDERETRCLHFRVLAQESELVEVTRS